MSKRLAGALAALLAVLVLVSCSQSQDSTGETARRSDTELSESSAPDNAEDSDDDSYTEKEPEAPYDPGLNEETEEPEEEQPDEFTEGTDTACEITGFAQYSGLHSDMFLKPGDKIAVIAPSSLPSRGMVDSTVEGLMDWGFVPVEGKYVCDEERTLDNCVRDVKWALSDKSIKAVFCLRGGYGASQVMDELTMELVSESEKLIIGYSDISVFHSAWTTAGLPSLYACMSGTFTYLPEDCAEAERRMLLGEVPSYSCEPSGYDKPGQAEGILIGGNLSTFTAVLDTAYDCTRLGKPYIIFLEEVGEDPTHLHRYLTILKHSGVLDNAAGIVFGEWADIPASPGFVTRGGEFTSVADMICREIISGIDVPTAFGFPAGHGDVSYPLLMGETATLTVTDSGYTLEWPQ